MCQQYLDISLEVVDNDRVDEELVARVIGIRHNASQASMAAVKAMKLGKVMIAAPIIEPVVSKGDNQADAKDMSLVNGVVDSTKGLEVVALASGFESKAV
jgi:hypothetical protein